MNVINQTINRIVNEVLTYHLFEVNDKKTRSSVAEIMNARLGQLEAEGKIEDFAIICCSDNNTDPNSLKCDVAVKYKKGEEFQYHGSSIGMDVTKDTTTSAYDRAMSIV